MGISHKRRSARTLLGVLIGLVALVVPVAGITAADAAATPRTWTVRVGSQSANLAVQGARFLPGDVTIDAGDTVRWAAWSAEIHTVTFFKNGAPQEELAPFNPADPLQTTPQGGSTFAPNTYFNSGLITTVPAGGDFGPFPPGTPHFTSYGLTFPSPGTYTYYCLVHGIMMVGVVHVQPSGTPYPYTQAQYDNRARIARAGINVLGYRLWMNLRSRATNHRVFTGDDDGTAMLMRFVRRTVVVHRGQSVVFKNIGMGAPHTVTFGDEPAPPGLFGPSGDPTHYRGGDLNSGIIEPGGRFKVTFQKAGVFHYVCALHDFMGMKGKVVVRP
jgi:plastocyanin